MIRYNKLVELLDSILTFVLRWRIVVFWIKVNNPKSRQPELLFTKYLLTKRFRNEGDARLFIQNKFVDWVIVKYWLNELYLPETRFSQGWNYLRK